MGDNSITQTTHKTMHSVRLYTHNQVVQALSVFCAQYATKSWGGAWERG